MAVSHGCTGGLQEYHVVHAGHCMGCMLLCQGSLVGCKDPPQSLACVTPSIDNQKETDIYRSRENQYIHSSSNGLKGYICFRD